MFAQPMTDKFCERAGLLKSTLHTDNDSLYVHFWSLLRPVPLFSTTLSHSCLSSHLLLSHSSSTLHLFSSLYALALPSHFYTHPYIPSIASISISIAHPICNCFK